MMPTQTRKTRRRLAIFALVITVAVGALVAISAHRALPTNARSRLMRSLFRPVAEWRHGDTHRPETGPVFSPEHRERTSESALRRALASVAPNRVVSHVRLENGPVVRSHFEFAWQDPNDPALDHLIRRLGLDSFRDPERDELSMFRALTSYIRTCAPHVEDDAGTTVTGVAPDARDILDRVDQGATLTCYYYSLLMVQALAALGYPARLVASGVDIRNWHASVEVFSHTHRRWILADPDFDLLYERGGVPQNAWDLHDLFMAGHARFRREQFERGLDISAHQRVPWFNEHPETLQGLKLLRGTVRAARIDQRLGESEGGVLLGGYWTYSIAMRNDYLSVFYPKGHPRASRELAFGDLGAAWMGQYDGELTNRPGDLYFTVDAVQMAFEPVAGERALRLDLDTYTPGFAGFRVQFDEAAPYETRDAALRWPIGVNGGRVRVWPLNSRGVVGSLTEATVVLVSPSTPQTASVP